MTKEQKLHKIKDKIYKLLPELKKLEFGCEIVYGYKDSNQQNRKKRGRYIGKPDYHWMIIEKGRSKGIHPILVVNIIEIIGKPIGIAEVLQAIDIVKSVSYKEMPGVKFRVVNIFLSLFQYFNLSKTIDDQDKECIDFLYNIFK